MTYDLNGRLLTRTGPGVADTFRYDNSAGRWAVAVNANAYDSVAYDAAGRLTTTVERVNGTTFAASYIYDSLGRVRSRRLTGNGYTASDSLIWTVDNKVDSICVSGTWARILYNADLLPYNVMVNPGSSAWVIFDSLGALHTIDQETYAPSNLILSFGEQFGRDSLGRASYRHSLATTFPSRAFKYDSLGRLINACDSLSGHCRNEYGDTVATHNAYRYDLAGNRTDSLASASIGPGNRTQSFAGYSLTYDVNGNTYTKIGNGRNWSYVWNSVGQLTQVWDGATKILDLAYDAFGRRVRKTAGTVSQYYVHEGAQVILDLNGSSAVTAEYGYYPHSGHLFLIKSGASTKVAITDPQLGTLRGWVNANGVDSVRVFADSAKGVWGATDTSVVRFRLAGAEYDQETGLYYMRARYYDPQLGRFLSEDPIGIEGGLNLYAYVGDDPVNGSDPTGLRQVCDRYIVTTWATRDGKKVAIINRYTYQECHDDHSFDIVASVLDRPFPHWARREMALAGLTRDPAQRDAGFNACAAGKVAEGSLKGLKRGFLAGLSAGIRFSDPIAREAALDAGIIAGAGSFEAGGSAAMPALVVTYVVVRGAIITMFTVGGMAVGSFDGMVRGAVSAYSFGACPQGLE